MLFCGAAQSAQVVNVEYIHNAIAQKWDISVPYNSELTNPRVAANMKYLLTAIDVANKILNGKKTTDYGTGEYATTVAADTVATDTAVDGLIKKEEKYKFTATTTSDTTSFSFSISAAGTFYVDWGDGTEEVIEKPTTDAVTYSHDYATAGVYDVRIGGLATRYDTPSMYKPSIRFYATQMASTIADISGCLGCIFPTLTDGSQPCFANTFIFGAFQKIPENLLDGISENFVDYMFFNMFYSCSSLTGASAKINGKYIYEILPDGMYQVAGMYCGCPRLNDYAAMPFIYKVNTSG